MSREETALSINDTVALMVNSRERSYFYRIRCYGGGGFSTSTTATSYDEAVEKIIRQNNIIAKEEYHQGGLYDGCLWRRELFYNGNKIRTFEICPPAIY